MRCNGLGFVCFTVFPANMAIHRTPNRIYIILKAYFFAFNWSLIYCESKCEYADIHLTTQDGLEQVFTVKNLQPTDKACKQCNCERQSGSDSGAGKCASKPDSSCTGSGARVMYSTPATKSLDLTPTVTILIGDIITACGKYWSFSWTNTGGLTIYSY